MSNICMLVTNSVRKDPRVQKEAMSAVSAGHNVTVIGIKDQNYDPDFIKSVPYSIVLIDNIANNFKRFSLQWFIVGTTKASRYNNSFIRLVTKYKPDIIHSNDYDTLHAGYKASKKCGSKLVYDSHEIATGSLLAERFKIVKAYIKWQEGRIIKKANAVISVSNAAADYLAELYGIRRPYVITNCPNYYQEKEQIQDSDKFEVLYQGIMSYGRGYEELIRSINLTDERVSFVIRGYGETKQELEQLSISEGVSSRISFAPPVEIEELIPAAATSSVGVVLTKNVCTNYVMTVSNKLFEYIQAGLPVIMSNVPEHCYLNEKYHFGIIVDEVTPEAISTAVNRLFIENDLYNSLKQNVQNAKRDLCWESFEKKLLQIYAG